MRLRVLAFARVRELLGEHVLELDLREGSTAADAWRALESREARLGDLAGSTRIARNGRVVPLTQPLEDGDELTLLPPVGGG
jgi:molybdopterin converting factor small subunit